MVHFVNSKRSCLRCKYAVRVQGLEFTSTRFMQSDPLWSCAMAVNVYLVFFRRYDAARLKKLYWYYGILCYGLPFIPAMFCLFYRTKEKGKMYGNATVGTLTVILISSNGIAVVLDR